MKLGFNTVNTDLSPTSPAGNAGWGTIGGMPEQRPQSDRISYEGINLLGAGQVNTITNSEKPTSLSLFPDMGAQTDNFFEAKEGTSPFSVNENSFTNAWGGGGPQMGAIKMFV